MNRLLWLLASFVCTNANQQCKPVAYSQKGRYLKDHVISSGSTAFIGKCLAKCANEPRCRSINFRFDGSFCELNDATRYTHPSDYVSREGHAYSDYPVSKDCPQSWVRHGNSCYNVINTPTINFTDARSPCQNLGGDLAIIRSAEENSFILDLLKKQDIVENAWLGLYRKADTKFYWIDDTPLEGQYSAWASGEPGNIEDCVMIYAKGNTPGKWNDRFCSKPISGGPIIVCQIRFT